MIMNGRQQRYLNLNFWTAGQQNGNNCSADNYDNYDNYDIGFSFIQYGFFLFDFILIYI